MEWADVIGIGPGLGVEEHAGVLLWNRFGSLGPDRS